ncbi:MAG: transketolase [Methylacidiphilales bacterium]|nr:transketolase [Candidatus Methylacidiphilales bacterium]MDW8349054.1 transketolase [Verrucomicrobiae bacterium]
MQHPTPTTEPPTFTTTPIEHLIANTIRILTIDAIEKAHSGHPGLPMGCADFATILWTQFLRHNPANPHWPNRDRFILSAGHGSMLLYSLLHLCGYPHITLEQLQKFRQLHSLTPGHPEAHETPGVEVTTGPLGQGTGNSVGLAIAQKHLAALFNTPDFNLFDHRIYTIVSDGDLQEGISHEAASLAGHLGLDNLIWFYDDNRVSIEGFTDLAYSDDVPTRFRAYNWHVITIDGHNHSQIHAALREALTITGRPTLIIGKTTIGKGSPKLQGQPKAHSDALGPQEVAATKRALGWPEDSQFLIPSRVTAYFQKLRHELAAQETEWNRTLQAYTRAYPQKAALLKKIQEKQIPTNLPDLLPQFQAGQNLATRNASGQILTTLFDHLPHLIGGSADLAPSTKTWIKTHGSFQKNHYHGRNLHFGIREHTMAAILNGIAYHRSGLIPFGATFFAFTDYMRPPIRLGALSKLHTIYVLTHDSIFVGEDGPTHQPVEHLAALRAIPRLSLIRPADANETAQAWLVALSQQDRPTLLVLTRQDIPTLDRSKCAPATGLRQGAYILWEANPNVPPQIILIGTGSEVHLCLQAAEHLAAEGYAPRVVSMPSWDLFEAQPQSYKDHVLPPSIPARIAVEAGIRMGWERYIGEKGLFIGVERFGASAPHTRLQEAYGLTVPHILSKTRALLPPTP